MREDRYTTTPHDAARYEAHRVQDDYDDPDRPTLADCIPVDRVCPPHQWNETTWVCRTCGQVCT